MALRWGGGGSGGGGGGGQGNIQWQDDGTNTGSPGQATTVNVTGGASVSVAGSTATISVTGSLTLIDVNTTLTVGSGGTYATFAAAQAYLETVVIADGVTITLEYVGSTMTEQVFFTNWKSGLVITSSGSVTATPTGWTDVNASLPYPAMFNFSGCPSITVEGTWTVSGIALLEAHEQSNITLNAPTLSGWLADFYQTTGSTLVNGGTYTNLFAEDVEVSGTVLLAGATVNGSLAYGDAAVSVQNCTVNGAVTGGAGGTLSIMGSTVTTSAATALQSSQTGGTITSTGNTYTLTGSSGTYLSANGVGSIQSYGDTFTLGNGLTLANASYSGHIQLADAKNAGSGTPANRFVMVNGGLIQTDGTATTATWGSDNIDANSLKIGA